ncbi:uncharacterized protein LOC126570070 [Anopheles aquasalis]|uniref:uncharacterized protein LOC126570070 n=1 Tax=Anopheles aquasalis TaxID=42839 RepID=UPI00215A612E|nr:uncharacterized protein LOC126570070 [Anopheles aquasalis]
MDNLRNLFGQVSAMTSMKAPSMAGTSPPSKLGSMGAGYGGGDGGASGSFANSRGSTKDHKTADRDNYYYIMWRS